MHLLYRDYAIRVLFSDNMAWISKFLGFLVTGSKFAPVLVDDQVHSDIKIRYHCSSNGRCS